MDESKDQGQEGGQGGSLFDTVTSKGKEYLSDPQNQEQLMGQAKEHVGNVPGMDQVSGLMGQGGQSTQASTDETATADASSQTDQGGSSESDDQSQGAD